VVNALRDERLLPETRATCELWIVVSHDCDVCNSNIEAEPFVEVVPARIVEEGGRDGNKNWGKNPRKIQFALQRQDESVHYEVSIHDLTRIPKTFLSIPPDASDSIDAENLNAIIRWISKRYIRASFPDNFNDRTRPAVRALRKELKQRGRLLTGIYMIVDDEELENENDYEIIVWATMRDQNYGNPDERQHAQALVDQIEAQFVACEGIDITAIELRAESEVSLADLYLLKRWDFDDLSLRDSEDSEFPPNA
jgi:hypothetical protein